MGFDHVGIARAEYMDEEARRLEAWLNRGYHGTMYWMARHFDLRVDPRKLVPEARSVIVLTYNYYPAQQPPHADVPRIARYAWGRDYHKVIRKKLKQLLRWLKDESGTDVQGRGFVDSAPVLERDWARRAGIGWQGKHTLLLRKGEGSWFFLAALIVDLELPADPPVRTDHCGTCRRCIEACPTGAIDAHGYVLDARRCISYLTIELKDAIPHQFTDQLKGWVFGCDICQEVCPWNRFARPHHEPNFAPHPKLWHMTREDWQALTRETFDEVFSGTPVERAGYEKLMETIRLLPSAKSSTEPSP